MPESGLVITITQPRGQDVSVEAFDYECQEAHKSRREFLQGGNIAILSHEHYAAKDIHEGIVPCMDIYEVDDIGPLLSGKVLLEEGGDGLLMTHTYTYRLLSSHGATASHASTLPEDLVMVSFEPPLTHLDEMNRWYEEEHTPLLAKVPGWISTVRGKMVLMSQEADQDYPKYVAVHRWSTGHGRGKSQEWTDATSTPWRESLREVIDRNGKSDRKEWLFKAV